MTIEKPRFYIMDLNNYHRDFLRKIVLWQDEEIKRLKENKKSSFKRIDDSILKEKF